VQVLSFASRVRELVPEAIAPSAVPFAPLADARTGGAGTRGSRVDGAATAGVGADTLGSATRFEATWATTRAWTLEAKARGEAPHIVLVGDGGITDGSGARRAFEACRREGVRVSVVNVADRGVRRALADYARATGGSIVEAGAAAGLAEHGRTAAPLREAVRRLFAPAVEVRGFDEALPAGEAHVAFGFGHRGGLARAPEGVSPIGASSAEAVAVGHWAAAQLDRAPATWTVGVPRTLVPPAELAAARCGELSSTDAPPSAGPPLSLAFPRACAPAPPPAPPPDPLAGRGVPPEVLLDNLRSRIIPAARGCLRDERRGRLDHAVRAVFRFRLEDREVTRAEVEGNLDETLRACLMTTIDTLDVPRFEGAIVVSYPIYTQRVEALPAIEIAPDVEERLRILFGEPGSASWPGL
jgi:hypothetical protein